MDQYKQIHPTPEQIKEWKNTPVVEKPKPPTHEQAKRELGFDFRNPPEVPR
jgi:hypothetical protein